MKRSSLTVYWNCFTPRDSTWSAKPFNTREVIYFTIKSHIEIFSTQKYINIAKDTAGKQDKLNIQIKSIKTPMNTMFTQMIFTNLIL